MHACLIKQIVFVPVSEKVFWSQQMQRRRRSLSIESVSSMKEVRVVHETGHLGTGQRHFPSHCLVRCHNILKGFRAVRSNINCVDHKLALSENSKSIESMKQVKRSLDEISGMYFPSRCSWVRCHNILEGGCGNLERTLEKYGITLSDQYLR